MEKIIEVKNLSREYELKKNNCKKEKILALNNISFNVYKGEIFGILGPNGAGKTTIIKILSTMLAPTSGYAKIFGYDTFLNDIKIRNRINFIFGGELGLYGRLTAYENMVYFANLYNVKSDEINKKVNELLNLVGITEFKNKRVEIFSKGMKQKLQIARGLINNPDVLFLDEPTIGLDPVASNNLKEIIKKLKSEEKTIILTTHYMAEADELCDRIAILNKGNILKLDTPDNLKNVYSKENVILIKAKKIPINIIEKIKSNLDVLFTDYNVLSDFDTLLINYDSNLTFNQILQILSEVEIYEITKRKATLEDAYIKMVKGE